MLTDWNHLKKLMEAITDFVAKHEFLQDIVDFVSDLSVIDSIKILGSLAFLLFFFATKLRARRELKKLNFSYDDLDVSEKPRSMVVCVMDVKACQWCLVMERDVWRNPDVLEAIRRINLSLARVPPSVGTGLAKGLGLQKIKGYPTTIIFDASGSEATRIVGYKAPFDVVDLLEATFETSEQ